VGPQSPTKNHRRRLTRRGHSQGRQSLLAHNPVQNILVDSAKHPVLRRRPGWAPRACRFQTALGLRVQYPRFAQQRCPIVPPKKGDKLAGLRFGDPGFVDQTANNVVRRARWLLLLVSHFSDVPSVRPNGWPHALVPGLNKDNPAPRHIGRRSHSQRRDVVRDWRNISDYLNNGSDDCRGAVSCQFARILPRICDGWSAAMRRWPPCAAG